MRAIKYLFLIVSSLFLSNGLQAQSQQADLILVGGKIATMDVAQPEAEAIAIRDGRILSVGSNRNILKLAGESTKRLELNGQFVTPGFIEGHAHFLGLGGSLMNLRLADTKSWDEIVDVVEAAAAVAQPGEWIVGRGWHQSKWNQPPQPNVEGYPDTASLSKVTPNNPVMLSHASGHMSVANEYAMRLAGVTKDTEPPAGGEILHDKTGRPIGVFRETAEELIAQAYAKDEAKKTSAIHASETLRAIQLANQDCLKNGITSFQDAGTSVENLKILKAAADRNLLAVRLWVMIRDSNDNLRAYLPRRKLIGYGNEFLTVRAVKQSIDGALGAHGAWLLAPYSDLPTSSGLNTTSIESVTETAEIAISNGFQVCVHAIGDRANREVLDIYEKMFQKYPSSVPRRWRIEHAQHLHPDDIKRFAELDVIASMQAVHCTSDAVFVPCLLYTSPSPRDS